MRHLTIALVVVGLLSVTMLSGCNSSSEQASQDTAAGSGEPREGEGARQDTALLSRPLEETESEAPQDRAEASIDADGRGRGKKSGQGKEQGQGQTPGKLAGKTTHDADPSAGPVLGPHSEPPLSHFPNSQPPSETHEGVGPGVGGDRYATINDNPFQTAIDHPYSTFSIDVDTAAYANTRRYLMQNGILPPSGVVRIEELINYFQYQYAPPTESENPFATHVEVADCPWQPEHRLVRVGIKGQEIANEERPSSNLVFLLDVSGSMSSSDKLPLLKSGMLKLVDQLGENDRVAIVVYAGASGLVLPSTPASDKAAIREAISRLQSGGSTAGAAGIQLAYQVALENYIPGGTNRVLLGTDGDFNVGVTNPAALVKLVEAKAKSGVFLSVLGFGRGNLNDAMMEEISNKGNGNYAYIDTEKEAAKVLVQQTGGTLVTIAKDVKIQIEFNPAEVKSYRLIGYANRLLQKEDFNDDKKDAGEIGAGHTVTALYEIVPADSEVVAAAAKTPEVDELTFQSPRTLSEAAESGQLLLLKIRYKQPDGEKSKLLTFDVRDQEGTFNASSRDFKFASAVAAFGMLLRDSQYQGEANYQAVEEIAAASLGDDPHGYRAEFLELVRLARQIDSRSARAGE